MPLGREYRDPMQGLGPEALAQEAIIKRGAQDVHDIMMVVPLRKLGHTAVAKSAVGEYRLPKEPDHIRMHVWIVSRDREKNRILRTQAMTVAGDTLTPLGRPLDRGYTSNGQLCWWSHDIPDTERDARIQRLGEMKEALALILETDRLERGVIEWGADPRLAAARALLADGEMDTVRDYFVGPGLVVAGEIAADLATHRALTQRID